jgi:hypothetical protein
MNFILFWIVNNGFCHGTNVGVVLFKAKQIFFSMFSPLGLIPIRYYIVNRIQDSQMSSIPQGGYVSFNILPFLYIFDLNIVYVNWDG